MVKGPNRKLSNSREKRRINVELKHDSSNIMAQFLENGNTVGITFSQGPR